MHFFESELNRIIELSGGMGIKGLRIGGRCCYGRLNNGDGVELHFAQNGEAGKFVGILVKITGFGYMRADRKAMFLFGDVWGNALAEKQNANPKKKSKHGNVPCVKMNGKANYVDWCVYRPSEDDMRLLAAKIGAFVNECAA